MMEENPGVGRREEIGTGPELVFQDLLLLGLAWFRLD